MEKVARLATIVLGFFSAVDLLDRLRRHWMVLDFRLFAELVGAILLIGSIYILVGEKRKRRRIEDEALRADYRAFREWVTWHEPQHCQETFERLDHKIAHIIDAKLRGHGLLK